MSRQHATLAIGQLRISGGGAMSDWPDRRIMIVVMIWTVAIVVAAVSLR